MRGTLWNHETPSASGHPRGFRRGPEACYLPAVASCELMFEKVDFNWLPRLLTTAMIATEMPAAIRPYSMAVAPDSSLTKRLMKLFIVMLLKLCRRFELGPSDIMCRRGRRDLEPP